MATTLSNHMMLSDNVVDRLRSTLRQVRDGELELESLRTSPFWQIVLAIEQTRRDLKPRPRRGAVYAKMLNELDSKHVVLWRVPRKTSLHLARGRSEPMAGRPVKPKYDYSVACTKGSERALPPRPSSMSSRIPLDEQWRNASLNGGTTEVSRSAAMARSMIRVFVPRFLIALLDLEDCAATRLALKRPELFFSCGNFLVMPNPAYYDADKFALSPSDAARDSRERKGFGLVCWWIHPELKKRSRFYVTHSDLRLPSRLKKASEPTGTDPGADRGPALSVSHLLDLAADASPYLYDVSDLRPQDVPVLNQLRFGILDHLDRVYAVRNVQDSDLYFHKQHAMWNSPDRAWAMTLHLHVNVNRARTPSCYCHSVSLVEILTQLRSQDHDSKQPDFEIINIPSDPDESSRAVRLLADSGFLISRPLTPMDLAFDDLLGCTP